MQVFLIDSNDVRRESLKNRLVNKGITVLCLSAINQTDFFQKILTEDIIILRDNSYLAADAAMNQFKENHFVLLLDHDETEDIVVDKINALYMDHHAHYFLPIVHDPRSKMMLELARKAAKSKANILLEGETGVGKEILARFIHYHSSFSNGPFVSINCAAIPENMVEAILFGYEKGAFTNAINSYAGKFEQAHNGTLLLDEVSEIPLALQAKLLRALQEREIERLCGKKIISVNVRIIAAANKNLAELAATGMFRKDLYYRLSVLPIHCVPLRERSLDIIPLAENFIKQYAVPLAGKLPTLSDWAKKKLLQYEWPGNIREMDNIIQRALIWAEGNIIDAKDIDIADNTEVSEHVDMEVPIEKLHSALKMNEAKTIIDVLTAEEGSRSAAARKLNMSPRTLRYKISRLKSIGVKIP